MQVQQLSSTHQFNAGTRSRAFIGAHCGTRPMRGRQVLAPQANFFSSLLGGSKSSESTPKSPVSPAREERSTEDKLMLPNSGDGDPIFPPYTVVSKNKDYALRLYSVFPVVEMEYARREEGYGALGSYFDGGNSEGAAFAYSQPVIMSYHPNGRKVMQMFVGARRGGSSSASDGGAASVSSLPAPKDSAVRINVSGGELVAVMQFEGYITPDAAEAVRRRLTACLERDGLKLAESDGEGGRFRCAQYGAVYQLGPRLNEMMLQVKL